MEEIKRLPLPVHFGIFEVDLQSGELRRQGYKVKLQDQPFQVLIMLLERPGEVVVREELQKRLWPADTFVDFERGLNRAINKLREALGDDADTPRYIETLPRRGYRFTAPVERTTVRETETGRNRLMLVQPELPHHVENDAPPAVAGRKRPYLPWAIAAAMTVTAVLGYWRGWHSSQRVPERPLLQFDLDVGAEEFSQPAISRDGTRVVFVSKGALAVRRFDQTKTTLIAGTEGAILPFFSPDGKWIGFFAGGKLEKLALEGGVPVTLCDAARPGGASWGDDDTIVASLTEGLAQIPSAGGSPQSLMAKDSDPSSALMNLWPQVLPGGAGVLFAATNGSVRGSLRILARKNGGVKTVVENSTYGRYLASGYLVYYQQGTLFAAPLDLNRAQLTGPAVPLLSGVLSSVGDFGRAEFAVSDTGTVIYRAGAKGRNFVVSWLYPSGKLEPILPAPASYLTPRLSPDGTRFATAIVDNGQQNLWVYDLRRETWTRLTSSLSPALLPTWTPDGQFLAFRYGSTLAWTRADGSGGLERLVDVDSNAGPWSFSADGKWLALWPLQPNSDLWIAAVDRTPGSLRIKKPQLLLQQAGSKGAPALSPDGRWVAYSSNESGRFEIYVTPFSSTSAAKAKWPVSNGGGLSPVWSRDGRALFYQSYDQRVEVASYKVNGESFVAEKPRAWSQVRLGDTGIFQAFDVAPDGQRVLALFDAEKAKSEGSFHVLLNVDDELRRRTRR